MTNMSGPVRLSGTAGAGSGVRVNVRFLAYWSSDRFMEPLLSHSRAASQSRVSYGLSRHRALLGEVVFQGRARRSRTDTGLLRLDCAPYRPHEKPKNTMRFALISLTLVAGCAASQAPVSTSPATEFPAVGIVDVQSIVPDVALDIRYAGTNNFVGQRVDGYDAPKCYLHQAAAEALGRVQRELQGDGLRLKIFDCYRPVRAVKHFVRWAEDTGDRRTQASFYPSLDKSQLLGEYIAPVSGHSRASTIDLTLARCDASGCQELDMGTPFDFFDERAHTDYPGVTETQRRNRDRLRTAMTQAGFENYTAEWWHYTLKPEPTPAVQYDIVVR